MRVKRTIAIVAIAAIGMASADSLGAQPYPDHPITVVYPFASGGSGDSILRSVSDKLSETLGQPIVIESRPGAGTTVGAKSVSRSSPNGYTLLCATNATLVIAPAIYPNAGYNPGTDFTPIGMIGHAASVLVVRPSFPARSLNELVALAKNSNRAITYGSPGTGTPTHLSGELLASMAQIKLVHVPYRGAVQALSDVLGGHIDFVFSAIPNVEGQIKSGNLRAVAVSGARRSPSLPETPTVSEAGLPGFETSIKYYLVAPAGTPRPIIDRLNVALQEALRDEKVRSRFAAEGFEPGIATLDEFAIDIERENSKWLPLIKSLGLKAE